jgi:hypothetical protein
VLVTISVHSPVGWGGFLGRTSAHVLPGSCTLLDLLHSIPCAARENLAADIDEEGIVEGFEAVDDQQYPHMGAVLIIENIAYAVEQQEDYAE